MSLWSLVVLVSVIALVVAGMAALVVVLVRRADGTPPPGGPVAAPGQAEHRATAARLVAHLDGATTRARTTLDFARLQLSSSAPEELAAALGEARASVSDLAAVLARTAGAEAHGPAGTEAAGSLAEAVRRAQVAAHRLGDAEAQVQRETRALGPAD